VSNNFIVEFYDKPTDPQPVGRVLVLEEAEDTGRVAEILKAFFNQLRSRNPQFHDAGLMCSRFIHWQITQHERAGTPVESRKVVLVSKSTVLPNAVVAEVYANSYRPEVRFARTQETTEHELLIAAEVLQQANI
jgi:hypothetical protein